jgi:hypothetical protein
MNKNVLAIFFAFFALLGDNFGQNKRRVLIEEFTNASCPPCAEQNPAFNELLLANYAKVTPIKYQTSFPGTDPMNEANPVDVKTREDYYEISGVPYGLFNGKIIPELDYYEGAPGDLRLTQINSEYNRNTPIKLVVNHSLTKLDSVSITITVSNNSTTNFVSKNLRLHTAIVEKNILFPSSAGTNGEIEFSFVMRKMFPTAEGTILGIDTIKAGQVLTFTFKEEMIENLYSFRSLAVVAFLQNYDTKEVFQSELSEPKVIDSTVDYDLSVKDISVIPNNIDGGYCTSEYVPKVEITNNGKINVNGFSISFVRDQDINTLVTKQFTDVLLPGQKMEVEFDKQNAILYRNNSFIFNGVNSGSELDIDQLNNYSVLNEFLYLNKDVTGKSMDEGFENVEEIKAIEQSTTGSFAAVLDYTFFEDNLISDPNKVDLVGGYGTSINSFCYFFWNNFEDEETNIIFSKLDLSSLPKSSYLYFDRAHAVFTESGPEQDLLDVSYSLDCGITFNSLYQKAGEDLATGPVVGSFLYPFIPSADEWTTDSISLSNIAGNKEVIFRFKGVSGFGDNLYIDNIFIENNITNIKTQLIPESSFVVKPNPSNSKVNIEFEVLDDAKYIVQIKSAQGQIVEELTHSKLKRGTYQIEWIAPSQGVYFVEIQNATHKISKKLIIID